MGAAFVYRNIISFHLQYAAFAWKNKYHAEYLDAW